MTRREWSEDDVGRLKDMAAGGASDTVIAKELNRSQSAVMNARQRLGITGGRIVRDAVISRVVSEAPERTVYAPEAANDEPIEDVWGRAIKATKRKIDKYRHEGVARIRLISDRPVALSLSSDWHLSPSGACDLEGLRVYAESIAGTPGAFALAVGDLTDNPIKWAKNMDDVPDEVRLLDFVFGIFGSKLLATTDGNHDAWSRQFAGIDNIRRMASLNRVHYAPDELVYIVEVASQADPHGPPTATYVIATRHQYRRNSSLNWTHACWRWLEDNLNDWPKGEDGGTLLPDVIAIGHNHCAEVAERTYEGGSRWAARMGPFQISSSHGRQYGWSRGTPTCPTFVLFPNRERPIEGYSDYRAALDALARHREIREAA